MPKTKAQTLKEDPEKNPKSQKKNTIQAKRLMVSVASGQIIKGIAFLDEVGISLMLNKTERVFAGYVKRTRPKLD